MRTIVFAYSEFGCVGIEALIAAGYDVAAVFTYRDDPKETVFYRSVAKLCVEYNIPAYTLDKENKSFCMSMMRNLAPDYIFSFYYRSLISDEILSLAAKGAYNLHGSLLPKYRGRAPVNWVLVKGEKITGVTLHHMTSKADAGDIVAQNAVDIAYDDTAFTLQRKLVDAAKRLLKAQLPLIAQDKAARTPQDLSLGSYYGRRTPEDGLIDWKQPAETIRNLIRAVTQPYPGAFTYVEGRKLILWEAVVHGRVKGFAGTVVSVAPFTIGCGESSLIIKAGQAEDGLYLSGAQLAQEFHLMAGMPLGAHIIAA